MVVEGIEFFFFFFNHLMIVFFFPKKKKKLKVKWVEGLSIYRFRMSQDILFLIAGEGKRGCIMLRWAVFISCWLVF